MTPIRMVLIFIILGVVLFTESIDAQEDIERRGPWWPRPRPTPRPGKPRTPSHQNDAAQQSDFMWHFGFF